MLSVQLQFPKTYQRDRRGGAGVFSLTRLWTKCRWAAASASVTGVRQKGISVRGSVSFAAGRSVV